MSFCEDHWGRLRDSVSKSGMGHLVAQGGPMAAAQTASRIERGLRGEDEITPANFDPLMDAYFAIINNCAKQMEYVGVSPLYIMIENIPDAECEFEGAKPGQMWPHCALCYLGLWHELTCKEDGCSLSKKDGFAWMLDRAVQDALKRAEDLGLMPEATA